VLGGLLLLAGLGELTGLARRTRLRGKAAWIAGALSGQRLLARVPEGLFRRVVAILLLALGVYMLARKG